ncbi:MAG: hypothetical protein JXR66_09480 [Bacteroidales bacterium]|nr:hypothetical protein [Bacteroidales bacterium]MBN2633774.1 hypothetical protein [Bacteroidales bacterium]
MEKLVSRRAWYKNSGLTGSTARVYKKRFLEGKLELASRIKLLEDCGFRTVREMRWEDYNPEAKVRRDLLGKLRRQNAFWHSAPSPSEINDSELIEKVLLYLDISEIDALFSIFPLNMIKRIWRKRILGLGTAYDKLNILYALLYFDIADPERYIRDAVRARLKLIL